MNPGEPWWDDAWWTDEEFMKLRPYKIAGVTYLVHDPSQCAGKHCVLHNPSNHHMRDWPMNMRESRLVERICPHGVGHPDPDSVAFFESVGRTHMGVHGCDGCCAPIPVPF